MTKLKKRRKELNLRLREVAERINSTPQNVWKLERSGIRTVRIARRYASALYCDWRDLLDDPEDPAPRARVNHKTKGEKR